jgi:indole-3-glycerol phosphate synthase / phosphoribosylanthranilate isomerase
MHDVLKDIVAATRRDLESARDDLASLRRRAEAAAATREPHRFRQALIRHGSSPRLIAEIKAASPSAGTIVSNPEIEAIARDYRRGGAVAISVVAEPHFFRGSIDWIGRAREAAGLPILMKHFVIDPPQIFEGVAAGADGILLLASLLSREELRSMIDTINVLGRDALVEVHDEAELDRALAAGATIIGVNNRNLRDFSVDLATAERLIRRVPDGVVRVAESGIRSAADRNRMGRAGFDAILVGEHLLRQASRDLAARELAGPPAVKICGITRREDALAAAEAGAAFLGLVFAAGSPRRIDPARAAGIASALREGHEGVKLVGVFRDQDEVSIDAIVREVPLDFVQLHGDAECTALPVIRAVSVNGSVPEAEVDAGAAWVLFDAPTPGGGRAFDWSLLDGFRPRRPFFLAGGLRPETVREAVIRVRPDAVDVSSGVEESPGIKSAKKIREFISEVRHA